MASDIASSQGTHSILETEPWMAARRWGRERAGVMMGMEAVTTAASAATTRILASMVVGAREV